MGKARVLPLRPEENVGDKTLVDIVDGSDVKYIQANRDLGSALVRQRPAIQVSMAPVALVCCRGVRKEKQKHHEARRKSQRPVQA